MNKYKIANITDLNDQTRTDGRYPNRIGSVVSVLNLDYNFLQIGEYICLEYLQDNKGNHKDGVLRR